MLRRIALIVVPALALLIGANVASAQGTPKNGKPGSGKPGSGKADGSDKQQDKGKITEKVNIPFFGNSNCPCGKASDHDKFVEVDGQKIYVCSDACVAALKKDSSGALAKAYPNPTALTSKGCATCGKAVEAGKGKEATFQGKKVSLCCDNCVADFKKDPALYIVKVTWPDAKDAKNAADPIDGKPVTAGVVALLKNHIIHFSTAKNAAAFEKDPMPTMTKLKLD
jgi:YHS domain-containing protein